MEVVAFVLGAVLLALTLWDLFQTVVVPRPTPGRFRIARYAIRGSWTAVRALGRGRSDHTRDLLFGIFGPAAAVMLLTLWLGGLILGYGLVLYSIRDQLSPLPNFGTTVYFAATSVLTLGFGDVVSNGPLARILVITAAATGLGVVALVVTFLFSLYGSYQRREIDVVTLQATAGAPPSAVALLEAYARLDLIDRLPEFFIGWQRWSAEVLDTHVAYPLLGFFRSSHDNLSWISSLGTVLDASSLVITTITGIPRGEAELARRVGSHLVEDVSNLGFRHGVPGTLIRADFDAAWTRLAEVGYRLEPADTAWPRFEAARAMYAPRLEQMANYWATAANSWLGTVADLRSPAHPVEQAPAPMPRAS
jgi:multisubunit Na+/H+ antiporter MnhC subunit